MYAFSFKKTSTLILIDWISVLIATILFTVRYFENTIRLLIPAIGLLLVFIIEYFKGIKYKSDIMVFVRRIFAVPFLILGFNWINIFTITIYRSHHRTAMIPLALIFLTVGLMLTHYKLDRDRDET